MADTKITGLGANTAPIATDILPMVDDPGGTPATQKITLAVLRAFLAKTVAPVMLYPGGNEPPATNYATLDTRNAHPVLDFDTTTGESAVWTFVLPASYNGGGITVDVAYSCTSATTGTVGFTVEIERIADSTLDIDADSFATAQTITAVTVPGTSGHVDVASVGITDGANMDSLAAGEQGRIRITRDVGNDDAAGDAELHWVRIRET